MTVTTSKAIAAPAARIQSRTCVRLLIAAMRKGMHAERQTTESYVPRGFPACSQLPPPPTREYRSFRPPRLCFLSGNPPANSLILRRAWWDRRSLFVVCRLVAERRSTTGHAKRWPVPPAGPLHARRVPRFPNPFHHDAVVARALRFLCDLCVSALNALPRRKRVHCPTFGHLDLILAELSIERVAGDAQYPGGLGAIAARNAQRLLDGEPLHLLHRERVAEVEGPRPVGLAAHQHGLEVLV